MIEIKENFLDKELLKEYQNFLMGDSFAWSYQNKVSSENDNSDFFFCHSLFTNNQQVSPHFQNILMPILGQLKFKYLLRAKVNLYTKKNKEIPSEFHIDFEEPHTVALFSVNTNNGYTLFKKSGEKIYSKENQLIIFDGSLEHCSVAQTDETIRVNINIDLKTN